MQKYHFLYDNFGNTTSIGLGGWNSTGQLALASYEYAAMNGLLTEQTYGNGDKVEFTYDILGRAKTTTYLDENNNVDRVLTYTYTGDGQLYSIHDSRTGFLYLYTYDSIGRLIGSSVKNADGEVLMSTRQEYNANNQLIAQHWTVGGTTYSETYTYSKTDGALTSSTNAVGQTLTYNYDKLRRLSSITGGVYERLYNYKDASSSNTTPLVSGYHYKDTDGELVYSFSYTYDELGNISTYLGGSGLETYTYDAQNQLTKVTSGGTTLYEYAYDDAGNILTANGKSYSYGNSIWRDLLTAYDNQPIAYEGQEFGNGMVTGTPVSGNPVSYYNGTRWEFDWEEGRNLVSADSNVYSIDYTYDLNGIRTSKTINGVKHEYLYASGKLLREIIYDTNGNLTDTLDFVYDHNGHPFALRYTAGGTTTNYYYITNLQGDVLAMITGQGVAVASYSYDPYGKLLNTPTDGTIAAINPLRYRGYYYDAETGFYYLQSRYYDPTICRFVNADSYASTGGILGTNMFAYCENNPVNRIDPTGEAWWHWVAAAAIVVAAAAAVVVTAGGAAAAVTAVALVSNGIAAGSTAATVAAGVFIGSSTALAASAYIALSESDSPEEFAAHGESALVSTAIGGTVGGVAAYDMAKSQSPTPQEPSSQQDSTPKHTISTTSPEKVSNHGGSHTRLDNKGNIYSYTEYDAQGRQYMRIDFQGKAHAGTLPHIHIFIYPELGGRVQYTFDLNWHLID